MESTVCGLRRDSKMTRPAIEDNDQFTLKSCIKAAPYNYDIIHVVYGGNHCNFASKFSKLVSFEYF